jgi:hypothetical protein
MLRPADGRMKEDIHGIYNVCRVIASSRTFKVQPNTLTGLDLLHALWEENAFVSMIAPVCVFLMWNRLRTAYNHSVFASIII